MLGDRGQQLVEPGVVGQLPLSSVEADVITGGGYHRMEGPADWSEKRPSCGSRFLSIDDSGSPIPSHGITDVEVFDVGVRWMHPIMLVTLRCPQLTGQAT